jgi:hypothetical protein
MPFYGRVPKRGQRFRKIFSLSRTSNKLKKRRSNTAVSLDYASSDNISPRQVAHFMVEAMYTLCTDRSRLRIDREKVSVGTHGDWNLGLFKIIPGTQPPSRQWNLWVLEDLLKGYIQRSRPLLRRRRTSYKNLLLLICLTEMSLSIQWFRCWPKLSLEDCFEELNWLKLEWSKVD